MITITAESIDRLECSEEDYLIDSLKDNLWYFFRFNNGNSETKQWQRAGQKGHPRDTSSQWMLDLIQKHEPEFRQETFNEYRIRKIYEHREQRKQK